MDSGQKKIAVDKFIVLRRSFFDVLSQDLTTWLSILVSIYLEVVGPLQFYCPTSQARMKNPFNLYICTKCSSSFRVLHVLCKVTLEHHTLVEIVCPHNMKSISKEVAHNFWRKKIFFQSKTRIVKKPWHIL